MISKDLVKKCNKSELKKFLGFETHTRMSDIKLFEIIQEKCVKDESKLEEFFTQFGLVTGVTPVEFESKYNCTKTERQRWTEENKLPIVGYKRSQYGNYPLFNRYYIDRLNKEMIEQWRVAHKQKVSENRKKAVEKAKNTRLKNIELNKKKAQARIEFEKNINKIRSKWDLEENSILSSTYDLAFWTVWISRWAKEHQCNGDYDAKELFYEMKNEAMKQLVLSPYTSIAFYRPENHKKTTIDLCSMHYDEYKYTDVDIKSYVDIYSEEIESCSYCIHYTERDYYSLYFIQIENENIPDISFSFHSPYSIGESYLPSPKLLEKVDKETHRSSEGMFRFGRSLYNEEKTLFNEEYTQKNFRIALSKYMSILAGKQSRGYPLLS
ncbi:hypothetical protein [Marinicrinis sediminis]|uniref:Uncharacterized protein n=1 Tax=Marinicrinis sediminis TaxID=1652465 RepID=A0ABW5RCX9_9BACL